MYHTINRIIDHLEIEIEHQFDVWTNRASTPDAKANCIKSIIKYTKQIKDLKEYSKNHVEALNTK